MKVSKINLVCIFACILLLTTAIEAKKRKKNKSSSQVARSKSKTKWSSTMEAPEGGANPLLATEEHGYYVKRTFVAADGTLRTNLSENAGALKTVPYLAIPIAWFACPEGNACRNGYSAIFNAGLNAMSEGFLCEDDCTGPYEPICGKTATEVAVFYNKCKLNVAKCRTHGYWVDFPMEECQKTYPKELEYTDQKFKSSPYFRVKAVESTESVDSTENSNKKPELPQITDEAAAVGDKIENIATKIQATKVKPLADVNDINKTPKI